MLREFRIAGLCCLAALLAHASAHAAWTFGVDDRSGYDVLWQESTDAIANEYATEEVKPVLSFACSDDGTLRMQVDWQRFISSFKTEAGFSVDDGELNWWKLAVDSSNKVTLADADTTALVLELTARGGTLKVEIAPYSEASVSVRFDLTNLLTELETLRGRC